MSIPDPFFNSLIGAFYMLYVGAVAGVILWWLNGVLRAHLGKAVDRALISFVFWVIAAAIVFYAVRLTFSLAGFEYGAVLVLLLTVITIAFTFGSEGVAVNLLSGAQVVGLRILRAGDRVTVASVKGHVEEINPLNLVLSTNDYEKVVIPNALAFDEPIYIHTGFEKHRLAVEYPLEGSHDRHQVVAILADVARSYLMERNWLALGPIRVFHHYDGGTQLYTVVVIIPDLSSEDEITQVQTDLSILGSDALEAQDITIGGTDD